MNKNCFERLSIFINSYIFFLGKVFPKLRRKGRGSMKRHAKDSENSTDEDCEATDYVFRIITSLKPDSICKHIN